MKLFSLTLTATFVAISLAASASFAMARPITDEIKDESVSAVGVRSNFALRANDGSLINFTKDSAAAQISLDGLKYLPPEKNANHAKCGGTGDVNMILALGQIVINVVDSKTLSPADAKTVQTIPRCAPYAELLSGIGLIIAPQPVQQAQAEAETVSKLSVVKSQSGYAIELVTKSGRAADFQITAALKGIKSLKDLGQVKIDAATTGQNLGLSFAVSEPTTTDPTVQNNVESCTIYKTINRCDGDRGPGPGDRDRDHGPQGPKGDGHDNAGPKCKLDTILIPGHRRNTSSTTMTSYDIQMSLVTAAGQTVLTANLSDVNFDTQNDPSSCFPDDRGPFGPRP